MDVEENVTQLSQISDQPVLLNMLWIHVSPMFLQYSPSVNYFAVSGPNTSTRSCDCDNLENDRRNINTFK